MFVDEDIVGPLTSLQLKSDVLVSQTAAVRAKHLFSLLILCSHLFCLHCLRLFLFPLLISVRQCPSASVSVFPLSLSPPKCFILPPPLLLLLFTVCSRFLPLLVYSRWSWPDISRLSLSLSSPLHLRSAKQSLIKKRRISRSPSPLKNVQQMAPRPPSKAGSKSIIWHLPNNR